MAAWQGFRLAGLVEATPGPERGSITSGALHMHMLLLVEHATQQARPLQTAVITADNSHQPEPVEALRRNPERLPVGTAHDPVWIWPKFPHGLPGRFEREPIPSA